jgi:hypothetical protein
MCRKGRGRNLNIIMAVMAFVQRAITGLYVPFNRQTTC